VIVETEARKAPRSCRWSKKAARRRLGCESESANQAPRTEEVRHQGDSFWQEALRDSCLEGRPRAVGNQDIPRGYPAHRPGLPGVHRGGSDEALPSSDQELAIFEESALAAENQEEIEKLRSANASLEERLRKMEESQGRRDEEMSLLLSALTEKIERIDTERQRGKKG
jgi:uncharacterized coiled-coil protein SlyX